MAELKLLYLGGVKNSLDDLEDAAFTQTNRVMADDAAQALANTLLVGQSDGLLAGSVVAVHGSRVIGYCDGEDERPLGLLINDVAGNANENTPAVASGKGPYLHGSGSVEVDVYETFDAATGLVPLTYTFGDLLYCSRHGLLTNEVSTEGTVIGIVKKVPTAADPFIGLQMFI